MRPNRPDSAPQIAEPTANGPSAHSTCRDTARERTQGGALVCVAVLKVDITAIQASDMYKNFYSSQGEVVLNAVSQSRLLTKPRLQGVLHGGGLIFESNADPHVALIQYWMTHPAPAGQSEFSTDPGNGTACPTS